MKDLLRNRILASFLICCVFAIGGLSAFAMSTMDHGAMDTCLVPMGNADCPVQVNALATLAHHVSGIQTLGEAVLGVVSSVFMLTLLASALLTFVFLRPVSFYAITRTQLQIARARMRELAHITPLRYLLHWLASIYTRDPDASIVVHGTVLDSPLVSTRVVFV